MRRLASLFPIAITLFALSCGSVQPHQQSSMSQEMAATAVVFAHAANMDVHGTPVISTLAAFQFDGHRFTPIDISADLKSAGILNSQWAVASPKSKALYVLDSATLDPQPKGWVLRVLDILPNGHLARTQTTEFAMAFSTGPQISSNGKLLFVGDNVNGLHEFLIDPNSEHLTEAPGSPISPGGGAVESFVLLPSDSFVYVSTGSGIWGFAVDPNTGALQALPSDPLTTVNEAVDFTDGAGRFLYVQNGTALQALAVASDGTLSPATPVNSSFETTDIVFDNNAGVFIESAFSQGPSFPAQIQVARQDGSGALAAVNGSPFTLFPGSNAGNGVGALAVDSTRLFFSSQEGVSVLNLNADGSPQLPPMDTVQVPLVSFQHFIDGLTIAHP